ncbi:MAG TPA: AAA family ATPase [Nocardioidaceae bacterium]|nr:AAA family ATPase [Nocardioidaceae bacterium]
MEVPAALQALGVTAREAEVLDALGERLTNVEIAERLFISVRTVESHVSALLRKLDAPDRRGLARTADSALAGGPVPLPRSLLTPPKASPLVGRVPELRRIAGLSEVTTSRGVRRLALITGEAGIGKSRLAAEAARRAYDDGAVVIHGRCADDALIPYQPFAEAIGPLLGADDPIARLLQDKRLDPATTRSRLFEDVDHLLASAGSSVVFVLDDVPSLDPSGLRLLRHLLRHGDRSSLLILATGRPESTDPRHPLAAALAQAESHGMLDLLTLDGLTAGEAETFATNIGSVDAVRSHLVWERTGGNPFLMAELLQHTTNGELPAAARDAIVRRVTGLGTSVFDALAVGAVAGDAFGIDLVSAGLGADASAPLERAYAAGLVIEDHTSHGTYRFVHGIIREAVAAVVSPGQRSRLHLRIANALDSMGPAMSCDRARHRHAALPDGDPALARDAALAAHDDSINRLAYELAISFADMALDAIDVGGGDEHDRADVLLRRGRAHIKAGDLGPGTTDCLAALELVTRHGADALRADILIAWAEASPMWGRNPALRMALQRCLADGVDDFGRRARLKAKLAQLLYFEDDPDRLRTISREAIDDARQSAQPDVLASVLATTHAASWNPLELTQRVATAREIVTIAASFQATELELQGLGWLAVDLLESGDTHGADQAFARHRSLAERLHQRLPLRDVNLWAAMRALVDGRFDDASHHIDHARHLGRAARDESTASIYWVQRYWFEIERDDPAGLEELIEPLDRIVSQNSDVPAWQAALALLHARRGDHEAAAAAFEPLAADSFRAIPSDAVWLNAMTYLAETCAFLGDSRRASQLIDALSPYSGRLALIDRALACKGSVDRFLGLLSAAVGDADEAGRRLRLALEQHESMRAVVLADRTRRDLAATKLA